MEVTGDLGTSNCIRAVRTKPTLKFLKKKRRRRKEKMMQIKITGRNHCSPLNRPGWQCPVPLRVKKLGTPVFAADPAIGIKNLKHAF